MRSYLRRGDVPSAITAGRRPRRTGHARGRPRPVRRRPDHDRPHQRRYGGRDGDPAARRVRRPYGWSRRRPGTVSAMYRPPSHVWPMSRRAARRPRRRWRDGWARSASWPATSPAPRTSTDGVVRDGSQPVDEAILVGQQATVHWLRGESVPARTVVTEAIAMAEKCGDPQALAGAYATAAMIAERDGDFAANEAYTARAAEAATRERRSRPADAHPDQPQSATHRARTLRQRAGRARRGDPADRT